MNGILIIILIIILLEIIFNLIYFIKNKKLYKKNKKFLFSKFHYEQHSYLPFTLKKNFSNSGEHEINYPLKKKYKLISPNLKSNNNGIYNGSNGNLEIERIKKKKRICCVEDSVTMNYLKDENYNISFPIKIQQKLENYHKDNYEVLNFGQGL